MKKYLLGFGSTLVGVSAFADGGANAYAVDTTACGEMLSGVSTSLTTFVTNSLPVLGGIASAFLVFWIGKMVFRLVKGWVNSSK